MGQTLSGVRRIRKYAVLRFGAGRAWVVSASVSGEAGELVAEFPWPGETPRPGHEGPVEITDGPLGLVVGTARVVRALGPGRVAMTLSGLRKIQRREHVRAAVSDPCSVAWDGPDGPERAAGRFVNISAGGAQIWVPDTEFAAKRVLVTARVAGVEITSEPLEVVHRRLQGFGTAFGGWWAEMDGAKADAIARFCIWNAR